MKQLLKISEVSYRGKFLNEQQVDEWVNTYANETLTSWRLKCTKRNIKRFICRKIFLCHHSGYKRVNKGDNKRGKTKNTNCKAKLDIYIKLTTKDTIKEDKYVKDGYPAVISIQNNHNHSIESAETASFLRPTNDTKELFESYFIAGMGIKESINLHESKLELQFGVNSAEFANAKINPTYRSVQFWFDKWRTVHLGPRFGEGIVEKLIEKRNIYLQEGNIVEFRDAPFAIIVVTKIMQQAHQLTFAKDIVFVDSTASCDAAGHSVTFVLTPCAIGAVPLAVLITKGQSKADYTAAFELIKLLVPNSFGGQGFPKYFLTDDSDAERNALKQVWPECNTLLCRFHVSQAVWRWLFEKKHKINENDRRMLYNSFKNILVSENVQNATFAFLVATGENSMDDDDDNRQVIVKYPQWIAYVKQYWKRKKVWCLVFRDATTHGHQTNNFSEVNVRLFKDIVLSRNKAFNAIALIDFTTTSMEEYYLRRIRNFVNSKNSVPRFFLLKQLKKASYNHKEDIQCTGENTFKIPSTNGNEFYYIDGSTGVCSCASGRLGQFFKHQAAIYFHYEDAMANAPAVTADSRYSMAKRAFGENAQPISFYMPLLASSNSNTDTQDKITKDTGHIAHNTDETYNNDSDNNIDISISQQENITENDTADDGSLQNILALMQQHHNTFGTSNLTVKNAFKDFKILERKHPGNLFSVLQEVRWQFVTEVTRELKFNQHLSVGVGQELQEVAKDWQSVGQLKVKLLQKKGREM